MMNENKKKLFFQTFNCYFADKSYIKKKKNAKGERSFYKKIILKFEDMIRIIYLGFRKNRFKICLLVPF